jgi:D-alanyl-D-alanine carboxypeptidase/D-alanyl-D-alanine-endopeptidase (penicillin-binding protein 4)
VQQLLERLVADSQMKHAILGLCVVKSETGEKVFELNAQTGLAPASCQKTITSAAAMELLGPAYRYQTILGYTWNSQQGNTERRSCTCRQRRSQPGQLAL